MILDSDVAELYGVESKRINEAVRRNPNKFPEGYFIELACEDYENLRSQIATANKGDTKMSESPALNEYIVLQHQNVTPNISSMSRVLPKAFTEKGLYMLATILKSPIATQTTIAIVETFTKLRELSGVISSLPSVKDKSEQKALLHKSGEIIGDILDNNALEVTGDETTFELNLALVSIKRSVKREKRKY